MITIYALVDPRTGEERYVGQTIKSLEKRLRQHLKSCTSERSTHKVKWLRQLLRSGVLPKIEILEVVQDELEANLAERAWIKVLPNLTNAGEGGVANRGWHHSKEARAKTSATHKGHSKSKEHREKISTALKGHSVSAKVREAVGAAHKGQVWSQEARKRISNGLRAHYSLEVNRTKLHESRIADWKRRQQA